MTLPIDTGYRPRPLQAEIHRRLKRFNVLVCHRRFGKTVLAVNELVDRALRQDRERPRYAYLAPFYRQAKSLAWDYLKHYTRRIPGARAKETELAVALPNGARIQLFGADNPDSLRGPYWDGAVLDEFSQMLPRTWSEVLRPALADREGFALFIGTPKGRDHFCRLFEQAAAEPAWFAGLYPASATGILPEEELALARRQMSEEEYQQEFECSFQAAIAGAYYGRSMAALEAGGRIAAVPWDPALPVTTAWDLGIDDATAIWFAQRAGLELRLVDYEEASGVGLEHYAKLLREKPYVYGEHLLPHDVEVTELGTGKSRFAMLAGLGLRGRVVPRLAVEDGIAAVRSLLPRCRFDRQATARGLEALRHYRRDWDESLGTFRPRPRHDWASHAADAFRYLAVGLRPEPAARPSGAGRGYDPLSYGIGRN